MGLEVSKKEEHEPIVIEIVKYKNIHKILSNVIIPFSEVIGASSLPDVYVGHEKIPFEKRYPLYQAIMRQEFAQAIRRFKTDNLKK